jgi:hypothetical protein
LFEISKFRFQKNSFALKKQSNVQAVTALNRDFSVMDILNALGEKTNKIVVSDQDLYLLT